MILSPDEINRRLTNDSDGLVIDPLPTWEALGPAGVELRIGTETFLSRHKTRVSRKIGQGIDLVPGDLAVVSTLEYVSMPHDLLGTCFLRGSLAGLGLIMNPAVVHPLFAGRLGLALGNVGPEMVRLTTGVRLCAMRFETLSGTTSPAYGMRAHDAANPRPAAQQDEELAEVETRYRGAFRPEFETHGDTKDLQDELDRVVGSSLSDKGRALERFAPAD